MTEPIRLLPMRTSFNKREWKIYPVAMGVALELIKTYHYARGASASKVFLFGLFLTGDARCYGISWWIPATKGTVDKYNPGGYATTLSLHRLVVHPAVPTNGASFLLGRSIRLIEQAGRHDLLVTYADTWQGHNGAIYRATNWSYEGMAKPMPVWVDSEGRQRGTASGQFGTRKVGMSSDEMRRKGCVLVGKFSKHVFTMRLKLRKQEEKPVQTVLF